jgi:predicted amidohydrolase
MKDKSLHVAIVQDSPVFGDLNASVEKAVALSESAAANGAQLICFGETWLPGYPAWLDFCPEVALWNNRNVKEVFAALRANSVAVGGTETLLLAETSKRLGAAIVIGVTERVVDGPGHGTLYNSVLLFDENGRLAMHHRKLVPTYTERMIWGPGDAVGLRCAKVKDARVGAMICWEHWMPLTRQYLHMQAEQVHIALWPTVHEMHQVASRSYAFEGRCFVLAVGQILRADALPAGLPAPNLAAEKLIESGGSAIIAPDGRYVAGPVFEQSTIVTAELDLVEVDREAMTLDVTGHYARPDIFTLEVKADMRRS